MEIILQDLNDNKSLDTILILNEFAKKYYVPSFTVKKIDINNSLAEKSILDFFNSLDKKNKLDDLISKYLKLSIHNSEVNGTVYCKNNSVSKIEVPYFKDVFCASIGVHEYTHAINHEKNHKFNKETEYEEILSYLNQFLFLEFIKKETDASEVIKDFQDWLLNQGIFYNLKRLIPLIEELNESEEVSLSNLEWCYKYFVGSLYSLLLYDYYNMDKNLFMKKYRKLYDDKKNIIDLLKYYDISLKNKENKMLIKTLIKK